MAPFFLFYYYQGPLQATLQALDLARAAMINSIIGSAVKLGVIFALASQPNFGINGAALGIIIGIVLVTFLHFATVLKRISFTFYIRDYAKGFIVMLLSGALGFYTYAQISSLSLASHIILAAIVMSLSYAVLLLLFGLVRKHDLQRIPKIGGFLAIFAFK